METKKRIAILGAGFGGVTAALKLNRILRSRKLAALYEIVLVDRHHHQLYTPALYEVASIPREYVENISIKSSILIPVSDIISGKKLTFITDEVIGLKADKKVVILRESGEVPYEFLICALGSETNYFDIPGLKEYSFPLKTCDDGLRLRDAIEKLIKTKENIKIVVGGGGPTGVELIAEFINFVCSLKERVTGNKNTCAVEYALIEAAPEILAGFDECVIKKTRQRLNHLGVTVKTGSAIAAVSEREIIFQNGAKETYDILVWTGGVKGPAVLKNFGLELSSKGSLVVDEYLQVQGSDGHIFAIGDNSTFLNPQTGKALVWNVPVAESEGRLVAKNIVRTIFKRPKKKFIPLKKYPFILAVGKKYAIADLILLRFWGFLGWLAKQLVELRYLLFVLPPKKAFRLWRTALRYYTSND